MGFSFFGFPITYCLKFPSINTNPSSLNKSSQKLAKFIHITFVLSILKSILFNLFINSNLLLSSSKDKGGNKFL